MNEHFEYKTPVEKRVENLIGPLENFVEIQKAAGLLLISSIFLVLLITNLPIVSAYYKELTSIKLGLFIQDAKKSFTIQEFVDEVLLVFFFLILGFEIKREFIAGKLSELSNATLVLLAASGGIIAPLVIFFSVNYHSPAYLHGWAIPMATDTAIAIGVMSLFRSKLPSGLFSFMAALAVIDDIAAISIIAIFYTQTLHLTPFIYGALFLSLLFGGNLIGIRSPVYYIILGLLVWVTIEMAGIHGAISGVLVAFFVPARPKDKPFIFTRRIKKLIQNFDKNHDTSLHLLESQTQHHVLQRVTEESLKATTPLVRWEEKLEKPVLLIILPLFVLSNGMVSLKWSLISASVHTSLFWGIVLGLFVGKPLGI